MSVNSFKVSIHVLENKSKRIYAINFYVFVERISKFSVLIISLKKQYVLSFVFAHFQFIPPTQKFLKFVLWNENKCFYFARQFIKYQYILTVINNVMVIMKKVSKIQKLCVLQVIFFLLKFAGMVFISSLEDSITSSQVITEASIILGNIFHFYNLFQASIILGNIFYFYNLFQIYYGFHTRTNIYLNSIIYVNHIFFCYIYIYLHIICSVSFFDSLIPVIMLKTLKFKSSVLFGGHTLLKCH